MKITAVVSFAFLFVMTTLHAQNISGEYYLSSVMETASGFKLNDDSTFQFFFSYGALDRYGKGKWSLQNDSFVVFNSDKRPPLDFKLDKHSTTNEKSITIQVDDTNKNILRYVEGEVKTDTGAEEFEMDDDGFAKIKASSVDSIAIIFTLCPDRYSVFPVSNKENYFLFKIEPWIAEVFFENFILKYSGSALVGKHPLLDDKEYTYEKD